MASGSDGENFASQMKDLLNAKFPSKTEKDFSPPEAEHFNERMSDEDDIESLDLNDNIDLGARSKVPHESKFVSVWGCI